MPAPEIQAAPQIQASVRANLQTVAHLLGGLVNVPALEKVALNALVTGGPSAVLPAMADHAGDYVTNPAFAAIVSGLLKFGAAQAGISTPSSVPAHAPAAAPKPIPPGVPTSPPAPAPSKPVR